MFNHRLVGPYLDRLPYLVMEYLPKGSLRQRHPRGTKVNFITIVTYVNQIAVALQYAHDSKVIHRDIKPENMLVGSANTIFLSDFGIAVQAHSTASLKTVDSSGTPYYMAPEHIQGKPRPASDQYSLAVIVYEWLCGKPPFSGDPLQLMYQHCYAPVPPLSEPSSDSRIEQVMQRALAKDPQQRFENIQAFAAALELEALVERLKKEVVDRTIIGLKKTIIVAHEAQSDIIQRTPNIHSIDAKEAKELSRGFLALDSSLEAFQDKKTLLEKLQELGKRHKIAEQLYFEASNSLEEFQRRIEIVVKEEWLIAEKYKELEH